MNPPAIDTSKFWKDGYLVIKSVFTKGEIELLRSEVESFSQRIPAGQSKGDILSNDNIELSKIVYDPRILSIAQDILGQVPVYFGDSTISIGSHHRGWHKDNRIPDRFQHHLADWASRYSLIRFGVYLQDHKYYSGGLAVRAESHNPSKIVRKFNKISFPFVSEKVGRRIATRWSIWASNLYGRAKILDTEVGDIVVWNQRTTHSGNALRNRFFPNLKMPKWMEDNLPNSLQREYHKDRIAFFMTYGLEDDHTNRAIEYLKKRKYMVSSWALSEISDATLKMIDPKRLIVKQPPKIDDGWVPPLP